MSVMTGLLWLATLLVSLAAVAVSAPEFALHFAAIPTVAAASRRVAERLRRGRASRSPNTV